jgi:hypothetical protein
MTEDDPMLQLAAAVQRMDAAKEAHAAACRDTAVAWDDFAAKREAWVRLIEEIFEWQFGAGES